MRLITVGDRVPLLILENSRMGLLRPVQNDCDQVEKLLTNLGLPEKHLRPRMEKEEAARFRKLLQDNAVWRETVVGILAKSFGHVVLTKKDFDSMPVPWWNEPVLGCVFPVSSLWLGEKMSLPLIVRELPAVMVGPSSWVPMSSYAVMLQREHQWLRGGHRGVGVVSLTQTSDGYFVLGIRAGDYERGKLAVVPAGSASSWQVRPAMFAEYWEELGVGRDYISSLRLVGMFEHNDSRLVYVYVCKLGIPRDKVETLWPKAQDTWEHSELELVSLEELRCLKEKVFMQPDKTTLSQFSVGALAIGGFHLRGDPSWLRGVFQNDREIFAS